MNKTNNNRTELRSLLRENTLHNEVQAKKDKMRNNDSKNENTKVKLFYKIV